MLKLMNNNQRDHSKPSLLVGAVMPALVGHKDTVGLVVESDEEQEEPSRKPNFGIMRLLDNGGGKKKTKTVDHEHLPDALFKLGTSLIDVNVLSCGDVEGMLNYVTFIPPLRHMMYANAIADGIFNFAVGAMYATYMETSNYNAEIRAGQVSPFAFLSTLWGLMLQGGVFAVYSIFMVPVVFVKLSTIAKEKSKK